MSVSLLQYEFSVRGVNYLRTERKGGKTYFHVEAKKSTCQCTACGSREIMHRGRSDPREIRLVNVGTRPTFLVIAIPRVECRQCGCTKQINLRFCKPGRSYSNGFERLALELSRKMTISDVADYLRVSWDTIKDIHKRHLNKHFANPPVKHLRQIAVDEICIGKRRKYLTLVMDLETGAVVWIGEGKGGDALKGFWKKLRRARAKIEAVAIDMSSGYYLAVQTFLPEATIVFDHFHVVQLMNDKLTDLRRELQRGAEEDGKNLFKGTRYLLLKNPENLDDGRDEHARLKDALKLNENLSTAYYLKEELRALWDYSSKQKAEQALENWISKARASGIRQMKTMAKTIAKYRQGILAVYDVPISSGKMEGTNNKIKRLSRMAYGFRDMEYFHLRIKSCHLSKTEQIEGV